MTDVPDFSQPRSPIIANLDKLSADLDKVSVQSGLGAKKLYVVYNKKHNQVLHDPMTDLPVNNRNPSLLRESAKQFEGEIMTAHEAFKKITFLKQK